MTAPDTFAFVVALLILIPCALVASVVWIGGAIAEAREKGWRPDREPVPEFRIADVRCITCGRHLDGILVERDPDGYARILAADIAERAMHDCTAVV